jgi:putative acyl-CoA dehydrogenase
MAWFLWNFLASECQASELTKYDTLENFDTFCRSPLAGDWGYVFGTLDFSPELKLITDRAVVIHAGPGEARYE